MFHIYFNTLVAYESRLPIVKGLERCSSKVCSKVDFAPNSLRDQRCGIEPRNLLYY